MPQSQNNKEAMEAFDAHGESAVPEAETRTHNRSQAAHLSSEDHVKTSPEGYGKQGREPGIVNQPPQDPTRNGKGRHRE